MTFSLNKSIFHQQLNNKFKRYKLIDLINRGKITVILPNLATGQADEALRDTVKSITGDKHPT
jgi:hypothetical protein